MAEPQSSFVALETPVDEDSEKENTEEPSQEPLSEAERASRRALRSALTLLLFLLLVISLLCWTLSPTYALVVGVSLSLVATLFVGLVYFVQNDVLRTKRVFHPYLHAAVAALQREVDDFRSDWQNEQLFLTYDATPETMGAGTTRNRVPPKPKSRIFRVLVTPFLPLMRRRRRRQERAAPSAGEMV